MVEEIIPLIVVTIVIFAIVIVYLLPTIIAYKVNHHNKFFILFLNVFLGWTWLGWIILCIWAFVRK